jgi:putative membrane protein
MASQQRIPTWAAIGLVLGLIAAPASTLGAQAQPAGVRADSEFIHKAASGGLLEVRLGQLAQQKAQSPAVKQFGRRMVTDHSKANMQLSAIAKQGGVNLPAKLDPKHQREVDQLSAKSGKDFDKAYMSLMVKDHVEDVQEFQREATSGTAPRVRDFAAQTLPTLQEHLALAKQTAAQVGADTTSAGGAPAPPPGYR